MHQKTGFSLIELMVVIALCMIIISLGTVNTKFLNKAAVHVYINELYNTCYFLQRMAMATGHIQELVLDSTSQSYSYNGHNCKLPSIVQFGIISGAKGPPSSPNKIIVQAITFPDKKIHFYPDGIIESGTVYLCDASGKDLYALTSGITPVSFLRKYRYDGKWHLI